MDPHCSLFHSEKAIWVSSLFGHKCDTKKGRHLKSGEFKDERSTGKGYFGLSFMGL